MDLSVATHTHTHTHDTEISQEIAGTHKKKCFFYFFSCFIFLIFCTPTTMEKRNEQDGLCSLLRYNDNDNCLHFIACLNEKKKKEGGVESARYTDAILFLLLHTCVFCLGNRHTTTTKNKNRIGLVVIFHITDVTCLCDPYGGPSKKRPT